MIISYQKGENILKTGESNEDLLITTVRMKKHTRVTVEALQEITLISAECRMHFEYQPEELYFLNGYQSWTDTKEYRPDETVNDLRRLPKAIVDRYAFAASGDQFFYDFPKKTQHGFDLFYVKGEREFFLGSRNYQNAYLIIELHREDNILRLRADVEGKKLSAGEAFCLYDFVIDDQVERGLEHYFQGMNPGSGRKLFGYTSWYNHYQNISEEIIQTALEAADDRFDLFQIDDGFEPFVGDWLTVDRKKFPDGLKPIVEKIHEKKMLAGIWLAPFAAEKNSALVKEHPEWIARDAKGDFLLAGANWGGFYPLDVNRAEVVDYVRQVLRHYVELGFDFFKLDFLYAASLVPLTGATRAQTAEYCYELLKEELAGKLILGCGAVVTNAFEKFDYMRIGPDVSLKFDDVFYMKYMHRERISTKVTVQNTIYRSIFNGRVFANDPDVFLLRDQNISLSKEQRRALATINAVFGSLMMTSDDPKDYDEEKQALLNDALDIFYHRTGAGYERKGDDIAFHYTVDQKRYDYVYNTEKGILING